MNEKKELLEEVKNIKVDLKNQSKQITKIDGNVTELKNMTELIMKTLLAMQENQDVPKINMLPDFPLKTVDAVETMEESITTLDGYRKQMVGFD